MTVTFIAIYLFLVVPDSFSGLSDFLATLCLSAVLFGIARYIILPWFFRLSGFNIGLFFLLFIGHIFIVYVLLIVFSLATGALKWTPGNWSISNFWEVILLFAAPHVLAFLLYVWEIGLDEWFMGRMAKARLKEMELKEGHWQMLSLQKAISPHFISNTLSAIRVLVRRRDAVKALDAVNRMACISNFYFTQHARSVVSLRDELQQVDNLVAIYALRHGMKIAYRVNLDVQVKQDVLIPTMLLINLVENALKYGEVDDLENPISLSLSVSPAGTVSIKIENLVSATPLYGIVSFGSTHERLRKQIYHMDADTGFLEITQDELSYRVMVSFSLCSSI
ncbi:histidine kinase [Sphingobacterium sp. SG20118]|uniref:histidine kinase n=1 Tax=Sphingobacterium sp. SG20118 TaxID=3367156 RepID=UPI0037DFC55F